MSLGLPDIFILSTISLRKERDTGTKCVKTVGQTQGIISVLVKAGKLALIVIIFSVKKVNFSLTLTQSKQTDGEIFKKNRFN